MSPNAIASLRSVIIAMMVTGAFATFSTPASAELDRERCAGNVAIPHSYWDDPGDPRTIFLTRNGDARVEVETSVRVSRANRLRWYCQTPTGWERERARCDESDDRRRDVLIQLRANNRVRIYC
jgi:hypothetical protein